MQTRVDLVQGVLHDPRTWVLVMLRHTEMKNVTTREFSPFQQGVAQYLCRSDIHEPNTVSNADLLSLLSPEDQLTKKFISLLPWEIF